MSERKKAKREDTTGVITVNNASGEGQWWFPLENNPSVMNSLLAGMGFDTSLYRFTKVLSIEPWALRMIPQPVFAVMMFYQVTDLQKEYHWDEQVTPFPDNVWYIQEHDEYTCGTIALLHTILNALEGENCCHLSRLMATFLLQGLSSGHAS